MRTRAASLIVLLTLAVSSRAAALTTPGPASHGRVSGSVVDTSGAALPGVTVTIAADGLAAPLTAVSDGEGRYRIEGVPAGPVTVSFELEGFQSGSSSLAIVAGQGMQVNCRLAVASLEEAVTVYGLAPLEPPPPPQRPRAPDPLPIGEHDVASVCGPARLDLPHAPLARIVAHRHDAQRSLYVEGDEFLLDAGTAAGLRVGQNLTVRRQFRVAQGAGDRGVPLLGEHTSGVIQVVAVDPSAAFAVVVYACDEFVKGDYVAGFEPEPLREADPLGLPDYRQAARVLFADEGQLMGAPRRLMVIDRGRDHGMRAGQRLTLFRRGTRDGRATRTIGEAIVVSVKDRSATIRIDRATDAVYFGDGAAPQTPPGATPPRWVATASR